MIGAQDGTFDFTIPKRPIRRKIKGLPAFTTVKGGAYFFLQVSRRFNTSPLSAGRFSRDCGHAVRWLRCHKPCADVSLGSNATDGFRASAGRCPLLLQERPFKARVRNDAKGQYPTFTYCDLQASPLRVAPFQLSARQIQATVLMAKARSLRQAGLSQTVYHFGEKVWPQVLELRT